MEFGVTMWSVTPSKIKIKNKTDFCYLFYIYNKTNILWVKQNILQMKKKF